MITSTVNSANSYISLVYCPIGLRGSSRVDKLCLCYRYLSKRTNDLQLSLLKGVYLVHYFPMSGFSLLMRVLETAHEGQHMDDVFTVLQTVVMNEDDIAVGATWVSSYSKNCIPIYDLCH
jgi:hypothetical protein